MTMFEELYALATTATLTMTLSADEVTGRLTVNVVPRPRKDAGEPALTQALSLTATPQEFDTGFVEALRGYRSVRQSLEKQAQATRDVITAAQVAAVKRAGDAKAKAHVARPAASTKSAPAVSVHTAPQEDDDEDIGSDDDTGDKAPPRVAATNPVEPGGPSFDLFG